MSIIGNPLLLGGGKSNVFAFIVVTYPAGSTLTATKSGKVLRAGDTSGTWVFEIPEAGTWTVTSTFGSDTATADVLITSKGQSEGVELSYRVPSAYQEVEFLQSSGTQYIDTNIIFNKNYQLELKFLIADSNKSLGGADKGGDPSGSLGIPYYNGNTKKQEYTYYYASGIQFTKPNQLVSVIFNNSNNRVIENDVDIGGLSGATATKLSTFLFAVNLNGSPTTPSSSKIYYYKVFDRQQNKYIQDFVPCYRKSDSVAGFWDAINEQFYTNAGTGTFIVGDTV